MCFGDTLYIEPACARHLLTQGESNIYARTVALFRGLTDYDRRKKEVGALSHDVASYIVWNFALPVFLQECNPAKEVEFNPLKWIARTRKCEHGVVAFLPMLLKEELDGSLVHFLAVKACAIVACPWTQHFGCNHAPPGGKCIHCSDRGTMRSLFCYTLCYLAERRKRLTNAHFSSRPVATLVTDLTPSMISNLFYTIWFHTNSNVLRSLFMAGVVDIHDIDRTDLSLGRGHVVGTAVKMKTTESYIETLLFLILQEFCDYDGDTEIALATALSKHSFWENRTHHTSFDQCMATLRSVHTCLVCKQCLHDGGGEINDRRNDCRGTCGCHRRAMGCKRCFNDISEASAAKEPHPLKHWEFIVQQEHSLL